MRFLLLYLLLSLSVAAFAVDFSKISREEPVSTTYPSNFKCYVDVSLFLDATQVTSSPVYIRMVYIIGSDTISDNIKIEGHFNGVVKQMFLDEGERLTVNMHLNNEGFEQLDGIDGSLRIVRNPDFKPTDDQGKNSFLSSVWKSDQTPLFRISVKDSVPQLFKLKVGLNENFEFNRLYLKMKVISPTAGILMLEKEVIVTERPVIEARKRNFVIDLNEIDISTPGTYYFQIMQNMHGQRINGIDSIDYELVAQ
ncbi:MAG: hypothetical protein RL266_1065 [Bacteroidota bacterium]